MASLALRFSGLTLDMPESECGGGGASVPSSPLLAVSPDGSSRGAMPRSASGQSIPIFFKPEDLGETVRESEHRWERFDAEDEAPLQRWYTSSSSADSTRRLSFDSVSGTSNSTAPTEPPSPLSPTPQHKPFAPSSPPRIDPQPSLHTYPPPPLNARRNVSSRPSTAGSTTFVPSSSVRPGTAGSLRSIRSQPALKRRTGPPPADAFFTPTPPPSSRLNTASTGASFVIPIRLVPPTPTPHTREVRAASSPFRTRTTPPSSPPSSPPRGGLSPPSSPPSKRTSKPLPSLPVFPTYARSPPRPTPHPRRIRTPPEQANEGVYNVPLFPPCVYPPPFPPHERRRLLDGEKEAAGKKTVRAVKSMPFLSFGGAGGKATAKEGYTRLTPRHRQCTTTTTHPPSTASSSLSSLSTFFLPFPGKTTLTLTIDQEGFREADVEFEYVGVDEEGGGLLEFVARMPERGREREGWPFHVGFLQSPPYLRRLTLTADPSRDYLPREVCLPVAEKDGVYKTSSSAGSSSGGREPYWSFAYEVKERLNLVGGEMKGERLLKPLVFVCSRDFLHPSRGRKIGLRELVYKALTLPATATLVKPPLPLMQDPHGRQRKGQSGKRPSTRG
ncbi:hypothetical protein JCM6882_005292 [Rhodosporidiobolus microsporus]